MSRSNLAFVPGEFLARSLEICYINLMATLRDVAAHAGVSVATASRVASGSDGVRPETRKRVERAMRELLYVAPAPRVDSGVIGLLMPELSNPIFPALAQAMETRATAMGFVTVLCTTAASPEAEAEYVHMLLERRVDGMIFISCEMTDLRADHSHYARLLDEGARLVFVNGGVERLDVPAIGVDERAAGHLATTHLLELGHERIGFVAGPGHFVPTREKAAGREAALVEAGIDPDGLVATADFNVDGGRQALRELLSHANRPTGVICSSDLMAIGVLKEARAAGMRVPDDLSVVGFDGIDATAWTQPGLTTIEQPVQDIAETAVNALKSLIEEPERPLPNFLFRPQLRVRASTARPAA
jgi:DNA-binding LacI/PurR family transcriptional regulator